MSEQGNLGEQCEVAMSMELWTVQEVAKLYRLKESWVYQHMGELPHYKLGNLVRFDPNELQDHLRKLHRGPGCALDRSSRAKALCETGKVC